MSLKSLLSKLDIDGIDIDKIHASIRISNIRNLPPSALSKIIKCDESICEFIISMIDSLIPKKPKLSSPSHPKIECYKRLPKNEFNTFINTLHLNTIGVKTSPLPLDSDPLNDLTRLLATIHLSHSPTTFIPLWNKLIDKLRKRHTEIIINTSSVKLADLPTFGTKSKHRIGKVKELLDKTYDTVEMDTLDKRVFSICSDKKRKYNKPCLIMSAENIEVFLNTENFVLNDYPNGIYRYEILNESLNLIYRGSSIHFRDRRLVINCAASLLCIPCCICNKKLNVRNIVRQITGELDKGSKWSYKNFMKRVYELFVRVIGRLFPKIISYCRNKDCLLSSIGIINEKERMDWEMHNYIKCNWCPYYHYNDDVHFHKIECYMCNTSYCEICNSSPYHEGKLCLGPVDQFNDIDKDSIKLLSETSNPCPSCKIWTEKTSGCDHIICGTCLVHWCYRCRRILDKHDPYNHNCIPEGVIDGIIDENYH